MRVGGHQHVQRLDAEVHHQVRVGVQHAVGLRHRGALLHHAQRGAALRGDAADLQQRQVASAQAAAEGDVEDAGLRRRDRQRDTGQCARAEGLRQRLLHLRGRGVQRQCGRGVGLGVVRERELEAAALAADRDALHFVDGRCGHRRRLRERLAALQHGQVHARCVRLRLSLHGGHGRAGECSTEGDGPSPCAARDRDVGTSGAGGRAQRGLHLCGRAGQGQ